MVNIKVDHEKCVLCTNCIYMCRVSWAGNLEECVSCRELCKVEDCQHIPQTFRIKNNQIQVSKMDKCLECLSCVRSCHEGAISIKENHEIDYTIFEIISQKVTDIFRNI